MTLNQIKQELKQKAGSKRAKTSSRFSKTGKGEYAEGYISLGVKMPEQRKIAKKYHTLPKNQIQKLLSSKIHTYRMTALLILMHQYKSSTTQKKEIFDFYLSNTKNINNWDLVDVSAHHIVGDYLLDKPRKILYKLAKSKNLWEKRIAIISTYIFIKNNQLQDTINLSKLLLQDKHDLIHKAVGWMLREVGKKNQPTLEKFLNQNIKQLPRTTLRYAIERFPENLRKSYLKK